MSKSFISCRVHETDLCHEPVDRYQNYESVSDDDGNVRYVPADPVKPALAADYSVSQLALFGRSSSSPARVNIDAVDLPEFINNHKS